MNSHGRREENLLLADLPCLDVEPTFEMASRELQSQLEVSPDLRNCAFDLRWPQAAKAVFEKAKNSIPKKMEELKAVEAEFAAAKVSCVELMLNTERSHRCSSDADAGVSLFYLRVRQ